MKNFIERKSRGRAGGKVMMKNQVTDLIKEKKAMTLARGQQGSFMDYGSGIVHCRRQAEL